MIRESLARPVLVFNALVLAGLSTVLAFALYAIPQQVLRQGLNDPQIAMATDMTAVLIVTVSPTACTRARFSNAKVSSTWRAASRRSLSSTTTRASLSAPMLSLTAKPPRRPPAYSTTSASTAKERVSWQPILGSTSGVRIAAVVERVNGPQPGFVLAGRNMREIEAREAQVGHMAGLAWLGMLGLIAAGSLVFGCYTRKPRANSRPNRVFLKNRAPYEARLELSGKFRDLKPQAEQEWRRRRSRLDGQSYSHSMVPGGLEVMS